MNDPQKSRQIAVTEFSVLRVPAPQSWDLLAKWAIPMEFKSRPCGDHRMLCRPAELALEVKHNRFQELMIGTLVGDVVIHASLAARFEQCGFTGYRLNPASVRFRNGRVSGDYRELIMVGWAGLARPESGIHVVKECPGCSSKKYSCLRDANQLVDWSQWTGEDFNVLWPIGRSLITKRVAEMLSSLQGSSFAIQNLRELVGKEHGLPPDNWGFAAGYLSAIMPEDLAIKYGKPLGLE
jgi:hypothetical protein